MSKIDFEIPSVRDAPPGGWKYKHPISGHTFEHFDYVTVYRDVVAHNKGNGYEMPDDWQEVFHDEMCKQNKWGKEVCRRITGGRIARAAITFASAMAYGKVLLKFIKSGGKFVEQSEAENRAEICRNCPLNVSESWGCGSCSQKVHDLVQSILGERNTQYDSELGFCGICHCSLKASVHYPLEAQAMGVDDEMVEKFKQVEHCWKRDVAYYR